MLIQLLHEKVLATHTHTYERRKQNNKYEVRVYDKCAQFKATEQEKVWPPQNLITLSFRGVRSVVG